MKREHIVERQGKSFVLYAGLLGVAHENGLKSIQTELIQAPSAQNGGIAICRANVVFEKDGQVREFSGIGDAATNNVGPAMQSSLIRMAETRAKARALRDGVNVNVSVLEETAECEVGDSSSQYADASATNRNTRQDRSSPSTREFRTRTGNSGARTPGAGLDAKPAENGTITAAQTNAITSMCIARDIDSIILVKDRFSVDALTELTTLQAGELIRSLSTASRSRVAATVEEAHAV